MPSLPLTQILQIDDKLFFTIETSADPSTEIHQRAEDVSDCIQQVFQESIDHDDIEVSKPHVSNMIQYRIK